MLPLIGAGLSLVGGLFGALSRKKLAKQQARMANAINPVREFYKTSQGALDNHTLATNNLNSRAAGAAAMEQGLNTAQMNMINAANRNATSSADALAMAAASQGIANQGAAQLATMEEQHRQNALGAMMDANRAMTQEHQMAYQDKLDYYRDLQAQKNALLHASMANKASGNQMLANTGMMFGSALMDAGQQFADKYGSIGNYFANQAADRKFNSIPTYSRVTSLVGQ